jgi:hypothetical protein
LQEYPGFRGDGTSFWTALTFCGCKPEKVAALAENKPEGKEITAADRPYYDAAKPFTEAIAARDYRKAYEYLSSHARARMSPSQFVARTMMPRKSEMRRRQFRTFLRNSLPNCSPPLRSIMANQPNCSTCTSFQWTQLR